MAPCNGTQQSHHVHCTLQWHPGATSNPPKWFVALPPIGSKNPYSYRYLGKKNLGCIVLLSFTLGEKKHRNKIYVCIYIHYIYICIHIIYLLYIYILIYISPTPKKNKNFISWVSSTIHAHIPHISKPAAAAWRLAFPPHSLWSDDHNTNASSGPTT